MKQRTTRLWIFFGAAGIILLLRGVRYIYTSLITADFHPPHFFCESNSTSKDSSTNSRNRIRKILAQGTLRTHTILSGSLPGYIFDTALSGTNIHISPLEVQISYDTLPLDTLPSDTLPADSNSDYFATIALSGIRQLLSEDASSQSGSFTLEVTTVLSGTNFFFTLHNIYISSAGTQFPLIAKRYTLLRVRQHRRIRLPADSVPRSSYFSVNNCTGNIFSSLVQDAAFIKVSPSVTHIQSVFRNIPSFNFSGIRENSVPRRYPEAHLYGEISSSSLGIGFSIDSQRSYIPSIAPPDTAYSLDLNDILQQLNLSGSVPIFSTIFFPGYIPHEYP